MPSDIESNISGRIFFCREFVSTSKHLKDVFSESIFLRFLGYAVPKILGFMRFYNGGVDEMWRHKELMSELSNHVAIWSSKCQI